MYFFLSLVHPPLFCLDQAGRGPSLGKGWKLAHWLPQTPLVRLLGPEQGKPVKRVGVFLRSVDSLPDQAQLEPGALFAELDTLVYVNNSSVLGKGKRSARLLGRAKIYVSGPISMEGPKRMVRLSYEIPLIFVLVDIYNSSYYNVCYYIC